MDLNNIKELTVKIIPKELGEIVIRLTMDNGVLKANLTAANKDTFELLNSQLPIINNELSKQNMSIQSFSLSLYNGDNFLFNSNGNSEDSSRQQGRKGTKITASGEEEVVEEYSLEQSNVNILA
nr:flagellar hook-length control protein FliK [Clostridium caldaquaticum]